MNGPKHRNPAVDRYAANINKPKIPNLREADAIFDRERDGAMPIEQIGRQIDAASGSSFLKAETVEGLRQVKAMIDKNTAPATPPTTVPEPVPTPDAPKAEKAEVRAGAYIENLDDFEYERMLRMASQDIINNDKEREAVKARVPAIDLTDGILTGVFRQEVPITPAFKVTFRSLSVLEAQSLKVLAREETAKYPRLADLEGQIYDMMAAVAAIDSVGGRKESPHLAGDTVFTATFDETAFRQKYEKYRRYPVAMLHAVLVHASWFDQRTRELFRWETLKNG
jgi:hypothetical protein